MTRLGLPEMEILAWLHDHEHGTLAEIGNACGIAFISARGRIGTLVKQNLVTSKASDTVPSLRIYAITDDGRRKVYG